MKPTLTLIAALLLMLCPHPGRSQKSAPLQNGNATAQTVKYRINGRAIDASTRQPIAYATASLTADSTAQPLTAAITDDAGRFTLTIGKAGEICDYDYLNALPAAYESELVRVVAFEEPLSISINGKTGLGLIVKPAYKP